MSNSKSLESLMSFLTENSLYEKLMDIWIDLVTELGSITMSVKEFMKLQKVQS